MFSDKWGPVRDRLEALEKAVERIEAVLDGIDGRIQTIVRGEDGLASARELAELERMHDELRVAVAEGIENVERRENRIKSTVGRALKVLEEHGFDPSPGLQAEARALQLEHADGSEERGVQPMREDVAAPFELGEAFEGIPGAFGPEDLETMRRRRGHSA